MTSALNCYCCPLERSTFTEDFLFHSFFGHPEIALVSLDVRDHFITYADDYLHKRPSSKIIMIYGSWHCYVSEYPGDLRLSSVKDIQCPSLFNKPIVSGFSGIFNTYMLRII